MKKSILYKLVASIVLVSTISVSTTIANAQRISQENDKTIYEKSRKSTRLKKSDKNENYNKSNYSARSNNQKYKSYNQPKTYSKNDSYKKRQWNQARNLEAYKNQKNRNRGVVYTHPLSRDRFEGHKYPKQVYPHSRYKHFYNDRGHNCYQHDRYGRVILRFAVAPFVIRNNYGDYYYSDGDYYRFYPEVGYVHVEAPSSLYFSHLPEDCRWISHQGHEYYTNGELCFVRHPNGFKLVKNPIGIHLSLRF
ncbi:DUF6515 family protein [Labilibaculum sp.]|uniref:DUF6515 family protein n=1 Tax=Labilibaculum sp. TaxID=2060723 RepID=UPI0035682FBC